MFNVSTPSCNTSLQSLSKFLHSLVDRCSKLFSWRNNKPLVPPNFWHSRVGKMQYCGLCIICYDKSGSRTTAYFDKHYLLRRQTARRCLTPNRPYHIALQTMTELDVECVHQATASVDIDSTLLHRLIDAGFYGT